ncbi:unnamed protein product, partial [Ilex paraguariensis]
PATSAHQLFGFSLVTNGCHLESLSGEQVDTIINSEDSLHWPIKCSASSRTSQQRKPLYFFQHIGRLLRVGRHVLKPYVLGTRASRVVGLNYSSWHHQLYCLWTKCLPGSPLLNAHSYLALLRLRHLLKWNSHNLRERDILEQGNMALPRSLAFKNLNLPRIVSVYVEAKYITNGSSFAPTKEMITANFHEVLDELLQGLQ